MLPLKEMWQKIFSLREYRILARILVSAGYRTPFFPLNHPANLADFCCNIASFHNFLCRLANMLLYLGAYFRPLAPASLPLDILGYCRRTHS